MSAGPEPSLAGDWGNMWLLLGLYFLQGIPIGLAASMPLLLKSKGATYSQLALFELSSWPYSLKWAWAPVVDALHTQRWGLGKRKSWVVPCQLAAGLVMIVVASTVDDMLPRGEGGGPLNVQGLLAAFLVLYFLVATQDIAVDGWALELLRPENVGYASTANTVGQGVGIQAAYSIFLALDSEDVSNEYLRPALGFQRQPGGMVSLGGFLWLWGVGFILFTLLLWALKREEGHAQAPAAAAAATAARGVPLRAGSTKKGAAAAPNSSGAPERDAAGQGAEEAGEMDQLVPSGLRERKKSNSRSGSEERERTADKGQGGSAGSSGGGGSGSGSAAAAGGAGAGAHLSGSAPPPAEAGALGSLEQSYRDFYSVCFLPNIVSLAVVLLTFKAGFATFDSTYVLMDRGVPKETLAFVDTVSFPLQLVFQVRWGGVQGGGRCPFLWLSLSLSFSLSLSYTAHLPPLPPPPISRYSLLPLGRLGQSPWTFFCGCIPCGQCRGWCSWRSCTFSSPIAPWTSGLAPRCPPTS